MHYTVQLTPKNMEEDADLFVSFTNETPDLWNHDYYNVDFGSSSASFTLPDPMPPFLYVGIRGVSPAISFSLDISARKVPLEKNVEQLAAESRPGPDYESCSNCGSWIPSRTLPMHTAFCIRNNVKCSQCPKVMKKEDFANHWHCNVDDCLKVCFFGIAIDDIGWTH